LPLTEFTDSIDCDLISIALVADDGREFCGERSDYNQARYSEFVDATALSRLCHFFPVGCSPATLRGLDCSRGHQFVQERARLLCFDYCGGWELLCDLLGGPRTGWKAVDDRQVFDVGRMKGYYRTTVVGTMRSSTRANLYAMEDGNDCEKQ
jgi:hypothetical protein